MTAVIPLIPRPKGRRLPSATVSPSAVTVVPLLYVVSAKVYHRPYRLLACLSVSYVVWLPIEVMPPNEFVMGRIGVVRVESAGVILGYPVIGTYTSQNYHRLQYYIGGI